MTTDFSVGVYYTYMIADVSDSKHDFLHSPIQDTSVPLYLGGGPETPVDTFMHNRHSYRVMHVLDTDDKSNPFPCPLVMAKRGS
ncbi:MAG: hypothetical protein V3S55_15295 [Nitrospiraceae bacterium]